MILTLSGIQLPHWDSLRSTQAKIRRQLNIDIIQSESVLKNKFSSLSMKNMLGHVSYSMIIVVDSCKY
jgi:hypothetical protein